MKKIATWLAIFLLGTLLGGLIVWIYGGFLYRDWSFSWQWSVAGQPLATFGAGIAAIIAAGIAFCNGQKTRDQNKEIHEKKSRAEQERTLRERFTSIVELLATKDLTKRESGAYALAALADDWAAFYKDDQELSLKEQQVCLNILTRQLRDPIDSIPENPLPQLLTFKKKVQDIIFSRFIDKERKEAGIWSSLELDLSYCFLYKLEAEAIFKKRTLFLNSHFHGLTIFDGAKFFDYTEFSNSHFHETAIFEKVNFDSDARFYEVNFYSSTNFNEVHFDSYADFCKSNFHDSASFHKIDSGKIPSFCSTRFHVSSTETGLEQLGINLDDIDFDVNFSQ